MLSSYPPCNPAGTLPLSTSEGNRRPPAMSPQIWLRRMPSNCVAQAPPGIIITVVAVDVDVIIVVTANQQSHFLLAARRGGRTVALAPNPPVSPPIAGPRHHLPPR